MSKDSIIQTVIELLESGQFEQAIDTYKQLLTKYPKDKDVYTTLINYLEDEFIMAELAWESFFEIIETSNLAIKNLPGSLHLYFHLKKLDAYIFLFENKKNWALENEDTLLKYIDKLVELYPQEASVFQKKSHIELYLDEKDKALNSIDYAYKLSKGDNYEIAMSREVLMIKNGQTQDVINENESLLNKNNLSDTERRIIYSKLINLYKSIDDENKVIYYQKLLNNSI